MIWKHSKELVVSHLSSNKVNLFVEDNNVGVSFDRSPM